MIRDVHQDKDGKVPEANTLQLSCVAAVEEALTGGTQVAEMQCLQNAPQVPAQTIIQAFPGDGQWIQQLLQAVVSAKKKKKSFFCQWVLKAKLRYFKDLITFNIKLICRHGALTCHRRV